MVCPDCELAIVEGEETICAKCLLRRSERKEIITEIVETEGKYGRDLRIIVEEFYRFVSLIWMGLNKSPSPGRCLWRACSPPTSLPASSSTWSS